VENLNGLLLLKLEATLTSDRAFQRVASTAKSVDLSSDTGIFVSVSFDGPTILSALVKRDGTPQWEGKAGAEYFPNTRFSKTVHYQQNLGGGSRATDDWTLEEVHLGIDPQTVDTTFRLMDGYTFEDAIRRDTLPKDKKP
jgi:hypothetical protein